MLLSFTLDGDESQTVRREDFLSVATREHIYNMPFEIRVQYKQRVYNRHIERKEDIVAKLTIDNGNEIDMIVNRVEIKDEYTLITFVHEDVNKLIKNHVENGDTLYTMELKDHLSYDEFTYLHHREELGKQGLVLTVKDTLLDCETTHISEWESRDEKVIHGVFRKSDISKKKSEYKILMYGHDKTKSSLHGVQRHITNLRIVEEDIDALRLKVFPHMNMIATGLNQHIKILDKTKIGDIGYCIMGIQRVWRNGDIIGSYILGKDS